MTATTELTPELIQRVKLLNPKARGLLIELLLDTGEESADDPAIVRQEWNVEIKRRLDGYLDGSIPSEDWRIAFDRTKGEFRKKFPQ